MASGYTDTHRLFLQAAISKRMMTEDTAVDLYQQVCNATGVTYDKDDYSDFVDQLNEGLNSVELEFRSSQDETNGARVMALTNTNGQKIAQVATGYTAIELEYFKHLLDLVVTADDEAYCISSTAALHESANLKNKENKVLSMTKREAEALLERFVADQWFIRSSAGSYSLSMRSILELQTYLKETYGDQIQECTLCMEIITKGQRCSVGACGARLHHHCAAAYYKKMNNPVCTTCHSPWNGKILIGLSDRTAAPSTLRKRRKRRDEDGDAEGAVPEANGEGAEDEVEEDE